jgi:hypothetical protein
MLVHQLAARFGDDPFGAKQKRHCATVAGPEADQMRRQFLKIAIRQISDDPRESFEHRQPADIALLDVGNKRIRVMAMIKRGDLETGAAQFKRQMAAAGCRLQHPALDRNRPQQCRHDPGRVEREIAVAFDAFEARGGDVAVADWRRPGERVG